MNLLSAVLAFVGHSLLSVSASVKIRHGLELPPDPGIPASSHGRGVPVAKSSHRLSINTPPASNAPCAAWFTAFLNGSVGTAGGFGLTGLHSPDHSASAAGRDPLAYSAAASAARASQNCG